MEDDNSDGATPVATATATTTAATGRRSATERIGARLGAARIAAGIELVDIARETRVPLRHLRAIEADAHDDLPALPYATGFVKSFARSVGMDPDEAGARFRSETSMTPHAPMMASLEPLDERRLPSRGVVMAGVAALVLILGGLTVYGSGWLDPKPQATTAATVAPTETTTATADTAVPAAMVSGDVGTPAVGSTTPASTGVSIIALDDAWIRVTGVDAAGKAETVKTGLLAKGQRYDVPADRTGLKLWTGRAGALQLNVDGRALPSLGGPAETVKNVSLDAGELRARLAPAGAPAPTTTGPTAQ